MLDPCGACPSPRGLFLAASGWGRNDLGFGPSLAWLGGNPSADPAPPGLLHPSPISLEGGTSEEREMHTSHFNFEVGEMVAGFFPELLLILPAPNIFADFLKPGRFEYAQAFQFALAGAYG